IGADPAFLFRGTGSRVGWCARGEEWIIRAGDPLAALQDLLSRMAVSRPSGFPPFYGGAVGYFGYDVARWFERLPHPPPDDLGLPDLELAFLDLVAVADHHQKELWLLFCPFGERFIKESREELYEEGQARLLALETRLTGLLPALPELPAVTLVSCSPERLVRISGPEVETRPIAGTRPRGASTDEDRLLIEDLLMSPKERAEHIMLVDLERNDLGRVCTYGSVRVDEFMVVERYSHVSHIVTNIRGRLAPRKDALDVLRAVFPGGTVTGVRKVRCMEIIDE